MGMDLLSKRARKIVTKRQERRSEREAIALSLAAHLDEVSVEQAERFAEDQRRQFVVVGENPDTHGRFESLEEFNAAVDKIKPLSFSESMMASETRFHLAYAEDMKREFGEADLNLVDA